RGRFTQVRPFPLVGGEPATGFPFHPGVPGRKPDVDFEAAAAGVARGGSVPGGPARWLADVAAALGACADIAAVNRTAAARIVADFGPGTAASVTAGGVTASAGPVSLLDGSAVVAAPVGGG